MSDMADDGEGWGGATPGGGGGDMGPNGGSEVVFGVTVHGVVDFAVRYQYYVTTWRIHVTVSFSLHECIL